ncbi:MAG: hypothetical protein Q9204_008346 [Flavoplaca sp. TL-2023a]
MAQGVGNTNLVPRAEWASATRARAIRLATALMEEIRRSVGIQSPIVGTKSMALVPRAEWDSATKARAIPPARALMEGIRRSVEDLSPTPGTENLGLAPREVLDMETRVPTVIAMRTQKEGDRNAAAVDAYKMEVETAALIRAAEDILSLTRTMKEMWLFGKLETVGTNEAEERADESARGVEEGLTRLMAAEKKK